ncbi:DEAD/DEAH box helicase [Anaerotignum propionicum]|uniref:Helicase conserved C-terminal domain-containing protein n=1 Tax=Anaerotignum propionicum DSM 1682 TaxID=991789 RepID=A0A0X1U915_ANAPI|nr:DEAD/DEAH box helicase [Anaerotignum propionicum]AMJ41443.1 RNA polymerase-associated protein RapA [Anaerotignum propionicum DSM 1682]SHE68515.1 Helicase conserved C-terminal domain-containing protein [[Clostridium] propionicum DSM 1682] [Anaerotignum propionicum DSM 1682]
MGNVIGSNEQMIDKINEILKNKKNAVINIVNDKLTISVFALLEQNLKNVKEINFVIRDTKFVPNQTEITHEFEMTPNDILYNSYDIVEKNKLKHFAKAKSMHDFIKKNVNVKKVNPKIKIGGNVIIIDDDFMIQGSSSLEVSPKKQYNSFRNINFDTMLNGTMDKEQILSALNLFNQIWFNEQVSSDYKEELLQSLEYVYKEHAPEFLYYFTLNELFGYQLDSGVERFERDSDKFKKTEIWNSLYDFQKDCVVSAIQKLQKYRGCIIADSVGLGKTFEALAIIKYFEIKMDNVLVLTPAKLYDNWKSFRGTYKDSFLKESFNYKIMFHTDLSRYKGMSTSGEDLKRFNWGNYDLVVIDESHNFRNRNDRYDENDQLIMTRYARLLQEVILKGKNNTKVLLLSATPVNNSLVDLKNQISIITADHDFAFEEYGVQSVDNLMRKSSAVINTWEKNRNHKKDELLDSLPSEFYKLLEMMTISRSRKHITNYYGDNKVGKFPDKNVPLTYSPEIDSENQLLKFKEANDILEQLNLSVYTPTKYIKSEFVPMYAKKYNAKGKRGGNMDFTTQAKGMIVLHRFNLFKRLESSVYSFAETLHRLLDRIDRTVAILESGGRVEEYDVDDENGEDIFLDGKYEIDVKHLRVNDYLYDLENDREVLQLIYEDAKTILDYDRDKKIKVLEDVIAKKVTETPYNLGNRKILIFSAFADTINYIYNKINKELLKSGLYTASISGSNIKVNNRNVEADFNDVLCAFSPKSKMKKEIPQEEQIDILIGTDCISEGQNLQDCDTVINFDIQWNPVSLIQRFGRIDRIGSTNEKIQMINFFPNVELNEYLGLEQRVKGKMTVLNLVSTGDEDDLTPEMNDFNFRKRQLERLQKEVIDIEDANENISLTDLNMNEYLYELSDYVSRTPEIKKVPRGVYSVTDGERQGVLFCFKHSNLQDRPKSDSSLYPYYLIYLDNNGEVLYGNGKAREVVKIFRKLCYGKREPVAQLVNQFFSRTNNTRDMKIYSELINKAVNSIKGKEEEKAIQTTFDFGGFNNAFGEETADDFELISFLVVE